MTPMTPIVQRLHPDGVADLLAQSADGAQDAELAAAVGDRDGQGIDDPQDGDGDGHQQSAGTSSEPLVHHIVDELLHFRVQDDEHVALFPDVLDDVMPQRFRA